uniref:Uncharacterized protein n=1 Tax=Solanum tuberosum TaxID=4113 RepID=M1DV28_SOLTU
MANGRLGGAAKYPSRVRDCHDIMSGTQKSGKTIASSIHKRVRTGTTIPPVPAVPRGRVGVLEESVDYMAPLFTTPLDVTKTKWLENMNGPTLTTAEHNMRDDLITVRMFGVEILCHRNGCRPSFEE